MSASTTRFGLTKPGGGSTGLILPPDPVDIDVLNANFDKIDAALGILPVLSTARPSVPANGQAIIEIDTRNLMYWSSTSTRWVPVGIANAASDAIRDTLYPTPQVGNSVIRTDAGGQTQVWNGFAWTTNNRVKPTLTGAPAGAVLDPSGKVTWTNPQAAAPLVLDNCFPDGFSQFRLTIFGTGAGATTLTAILRTAVPADDVTNNYQVTENLARNATVSSTTSAVAASWVIPNVQTMFALEGTLRSPNEARETTMLATLGTSPNPQVSGVPSLLSQRFLTHGGSTIMRGLKLVVGANIVGVLEVVIDGIPD